MVPATSSLHPASVRGCHVFARRSQSNNDLVGVDIDSCFEELRALPDVRQFIIRRRVGIDTFEQPPEFLINLLNCHDHELMRELRAVYS